MTQIKKVKDVLQITVEMAPFAKVGGLSDVCASLPLSLRDEGINIKTIMPKYPCIDKLYSGNLEYVTEFEININTKQIDIRIEKIIHNKMEVFLVDCPFYFERENIYGYDDEIERFVVFTKAILECLSKIDFKPEVLHYHDWHVCLLPYLLKTRYKELGLYENISTMLTIHNFRYQGIFDIDENLKVLGIDREEFYEKKLDFYDQINFMKIGLLYSDVVNTVSPTHAKELFAQDMEELGLRSNSQIYGILNGLDLNVYNPQTDNNIYQNYNLHTWEKSKRINKVKLQEELGMVVDEKKPIIAMVSRLIREKGFDLIEYSYKHLLMGDVQLIIMGDGIKYYEMFLNDIASRYLKKVKILKYDDNLARRIYSGADIFLMPSHYEPCGTTQLISMRYGTIPVVRGTGGLIDTVIDYFENKETGYGVVFKALNPWVMLYAIRKALELYEDKAIWKVLVERAMQIPQSWQISSREYIKLYNFAYKNNE